MTNLILGILVTTGLALFFFWLALRALRAKNALVKWLGVIFSGLLALVCVLATLISIMGAYKLYAKQNVQIPTISVQGTPEQVARGEHIATVMCVSCHSKDGSLPMSGGINMSGELNMPLGDIYAPNLTPAGELKSWSDGEIFRMVRTGVNASGRGTAMALFGGRHLSDEDIQSIVAYLRQSPESANQTPPFKPSLLLAMLYGAGLFNAEPASMAPVSAPPKAATAEYGAYVVATNDCRNCHGPNLDGRAPAPQPRSPNLTQVVPNWTKDEFFQTIRTGVTPEGYHLDPGRMPWKTVALLDDVELEALYNYLHGLTKIQ